VNAVVCFLLLFVDTSFTHKKTYSYFTILGKKSPKSGDNFSTNSDR